uniref:F-box protein 43 n=1 Tax=Myripristis murdjan TaxID=586833 RepID=A0A667ZIW3_9TELE
MNCTPDLDVYPESCKNQLCYGVSFDSGYSGLFNSPRSASGTKYNPRWSLSSEEFNETPKENLQLSVTPKKERTKEPVRSLDKDFRGLQQPLTVGWCETPKLTKRDATLRRRLLTCKSVTDVKTDSTRSPYTTKRTECSCSVGSELCFSACFDSPDTVILGTLASSTLKSELDVPLSGGKRRLLFSQVRTSTLQDGKHNSRDLSSFERKDSLSDTYLNESIISSEQLTTETPCLRKLLPALSVSEDSGFSSLTLDKSQDSSVDHDGSFQELLLSASKGNCETPNPAEIKRRSRLQRQHRLSTLKEGGSQSEEDIRNISQVCTDDVFGDNATPLSATSGKLVNLSLTPALQLVHAMCQRKAQMLLDQSPSLEEQLKSAASLAETPVTLKTTMPLSGLIGRKMGLGQVDILTELKKRNLRHILAVILGQLSSEDVYSVGQVCKSWNEIIQQDKQASHRRRLHLNEVEAALELGGAVHVPDAETRLTLLRRSVLKSVQAQSRTSSYCTPQKNKTISLLSNQIAKTLFNDECLKACPRCQHPARCHSVKREAVCSRIDCSFQFCTACLCAFHGSRECGSHSAIRRNKKDTLLPGSAQSKRNLRRL